MPKKKQTRKKQEKIMTNRFYFLMILVAFLFGIILMKITKVMFFDREMYLASLEKLTNTTVTGTSSPRGRIYDRNYNILVDNKSLKTITYTKPKDATEESMVEIAEKLSPYLTLNLNSLTIRSKREFFCAKNKEICEKRITKKEKEKVKQRKLTEEDIEELKLERVTEEELVFTEEEKKTAYLYYLMNKGYTYSEKIIKSNATEKEYAYISEHNDSLTGFNTKLDWERVYPYGET